MGAHDAATDDGSGGPEEHRPTHRAAGPAREPSTTWTTAASVPEPAPEPAQTVPGPSPERPEGHARGRGPGVLHDELHPAVVGGRDRPAIEVDGLTVVRGRVPVLSDLTCAMLPGRVTGLLGPSGAGKTTLMRAIVGTQRLAGGRVTVLGETAGSASLRRRIGYVTQAPSIYRDVSVLGNLRYFARVIGAPTSRIPEVVAAVGLEGYERRLAGSLSGGQTSRVSLACALVGSPDVLVLDEPTVGQDPVLREELWDRLRDRAAGGACVLVSSHVMDEAERCDDILLLRDGALLAAGTPHEIRSRAGAENLDAAFLALIREESDGARAPDGPRSDERGAR